MRKMQGRREIRNKTAVKRSGLARLAEIDDMQLTVAAINELYSPLTVVSARWSAMRAAATRRSSYRRLRREMGILRETLEDICESGDSASQPHTRAQLKRRIEELKVTQDTIYYYSGIDSMFHSVLCAYIQACRGPTLHCSKNTN